MIAWQWLGGASNAKGPASGLERLSIFRTVVPPALARRRRPQPLRLAARRRSISPKSGFALGEDLARPYIGGALPFSPIDTEFVIRPFGVWAATINTATPFLIIALSPAVICTIGIFGGTTMWRVP